MSVHICTWHVTWHHPLLTSHPIHVPAPAIYPLLCSPEPNAFNCPHYIAPYATHTQWSLKIQSQLVLLLGVRVSFEYCLHGHHTWFCCRNTPTCTFPCNLMLQSHSAVYPVYTCSIFENVTVTSSSVPTSQVYVYIYMWVSLTWNCVLHSKHDFFKYTCRCRW